MQKGLHTGSSLAQQEVQQRETVCVKIQKIAMNTSNDSNMFSIFYKFDLCLVDGDGVDRLETGGEVLPVFFFCFFLGGGPLAWCFF